MVDKIDEFARVARRINNAFHKTACDAYLFARDQHADPKYDAFRTSEAGRAWKQQKIIECNRRCPECNKIINNNNANIDHKYPRRHYPWLAWEIDNLWVLCMDCNKRKGDLEWDAYLNMVRSRRGQVVVDRILKYAPPCELS